MGGLGGFWLVPHGLQQARLLHYSGHESLFMDRSESSPDSVGHPRAP
jgi:hypothetical protein